MINRSPVVLLGVFVLALCAVGAILRPHGPAPAANPEDAAALVLQPRNPPTPQVPRFRGSRVPRFQGSRVPGFQGSKVPGFQGSKVQGFQGSIANRNLNPLNLKYGSKTRWYVDMGLAAISDIIPSDGGRFLRFDDPEVGFRAAAEVLNSYGVLNLDGALRKWSNTGYDSAILARTSLDAESAVNELRRRDLTILLHAMAAAEGYRSSTIGAEIRKALQ